MGIKHHLFQGFISGQWHHGFWCAGLDFETLKPKHPMTTILYFNQLSSRPTVTGKWRRKLFFRISKASNISKSIQKSKHPNFNIGFSQGWTTKAYEPTGKFFMKVQYLVTFKSEVLPCIPVWLLTYWMGCHGAWLIDLCSLSLQSPEFFHALQDEHGWAWFCMCSFSCQSSLHFLKQNRIKNVAAVIWFWSLKFKQTGLWSWMYMTNLT